MKTTTYDGWRVGTGKSVLCAGCASWIGGSNSGQRQWQHGRQRARYCDACFRAKTGKSADEVARTQAVKLPAKYNPKTKERIMAQGEATVLAEKQTCDAGQLLGRACQFVKDPISCYVVQMDGITLTSWLCANHRSLVGSMAGVTVERWRP